MISEQEQPLGDLDSNLSVLPLPVDGTTPVRRKILIVDDDDTQNEVLKYCFGKVGYDAFVATCGETGFAKAREIHPDLILLDIELPTRNGLDVCRELMDNSDTCEIPVIILSGHDSNDVVREARSAGCRFFIRKPFDPNALLALVEHATTQGDRW